VATTTQHQQAPVGTGGAEGTRAVPDHDDQPIAARLTTEQVWRQLATASFAVLCHVTPAGEPRSSGVVYKTVGQRLYIATAPDSWKARHIARNGRVAVTVPVRRGGVLSLVLPIPPATVGFHGTAIVHPADSPQVRPLLKELASLLPEERQAPAAVIEVIPQGCFVTYGVGVR
jgi:Pyridoxamine 5'-phosphate oxidase